MNAVIILLSGNLLPYEITGVQFNIKSGVSSKLNLMKQKSSYASLCAIPCIQSTAIYAIKIIILLIARSTNNMPQENLATMLRRKEKERPTESSSDMNQD